MDGKLTCFILTLLVALSALGQNNIPLNDTNVKLKSPNIIFENFTEKDGLSFNFCTDIIQDKDGYLWIGTIFGLNRFDGKRFKYFTKNKSDENALQYNHINKLSCDKNGNIWGCTNNGLFFYDKKKNKFDNFLIPDSLKYPNTSSIVCDKFGQTWAGSDFGLIKFNHVKQKIEYLSSSKAPSSISNNFITKSGIAEDLSGNGLWVSTIEGLNYFDIKTGVFTNYRNHQNSEIFNNHRIGPVFVSKHGMIWMLDETTRELIGFKNIKEGVLHRITLADKMVNSYSGTIFETSNHHLWYSSSSYETIRIEYLKNYKFEKINNKISNPNSISGDYILGAFEDKDNTIWFATTGGISKYNYKNSFYKIIPLSENYSELDENWKITCITENKADGKWWLGTRSGLMYSYDPITGESNKIDLSKLSKNAPQFITDIDFIDNIAIISSIGHINFEYNPVTNKLKPYSLINRLHNNYFTRVISQETDSTYILSNNNRPVLRWNKEKHTIEEILFDIDTNWQGHKVSAGWLNSSKNNGTWLAASNDMVGYIPVGSKKIQTLQLDIGMKVYKGGYFNALQTDANGNVWFAFVGQGLYNVTKELDANQNIKSHKMSNWDSSDGLTNELIQSAVSDRHGNIWCGAYNKYSIYNPTKKTFFNFQLGLSMSNYFYYNYMIQLSNGNMLTNIKGNLVELYPDQINAEKKPNNEPLISLIQINNTKIKYLNKDSMITLPHHENFISIGFGSLSDEKIYNFHYEYKLEGINTNWVKSDKKAEATYTDLSPGVYRFRLIAKSNNSDWKSQEQNLIIKIQAPFYRTAWFYALILAFITFSVYNYFSSRLKNRRNLMLLKSKTQLLEKEKTVVMYENLKQHLNPHFLFNSLTSLSSLIRLDPNQASNFLDKMSKVYRYILKNKDNETVTLDVELKFVDMYIQLQKTRFADSLLIDINIPEEVLYRKIAPVTLQNLVDNAIKHNIADVDSPLVIQFYVEDDYLVIQNNLQKKTFVETSNKLGQISMISLYRYLSSRPVIIHESESHYAVKIPLI